MDHRKNFVRAMKLLVDMDRLLARLDHIFQLSIRCSLEHAQGKISKATYLEKIKSLGLDRKQILTEYANLGKRVKEIENEYGGEIKS